jgi:putative transposase
MILTEKHIYKQTHKNYIELDNLCFLSKNLYNATLYDIRQHYFNTGKYKNYYKVNFEFAHNNQSDYRALPAKVAKCTQKLVDKNFKSFFALLKKKNQGKYDRPISIPKYLDKIKGREIVLYEKGAINTRGLANNEIKLSGTNIIVKTKIARQAIQAVRIVPCNGYIKVEVLYKIQECNLKPKDNSIASIDLGLNNLMTVTFTNNKPLIINGRPLKSINQYYNKRKAKYTSLVEKCNNKKTSKRLRRLSLKRTNKIDDYLHKSVSYLINQLVFNNISTLVVGYNKNWKQDINIGKVNNQNFTNIPYLKLIKMLEYKCQLYGINFILQEESYTSKSSFLDKDILPVYQNGDKKYSFLGTRINRGLYQSKEGKFLNADVNGSYNIMRKVVGEVIYDIVNSVEVSSMPYKFSVES